ncbi:hypothetical protein K4K49_004937 [Colletotrichum sp. SAR 10_70]|nr:hypothetical protein K4K50_009069 [Colletotrichum sp. SAR 10_71]KAI8168831.1 hypothetical protein K4K49_004937 [Colletotrichum sp. SAR 10_70]KAJ4995455.1 hypothetical protein K4K48_010314 [Colletotrichum sp. SAR 10_66]
MTDTITAFFDRLDRADRYLERFTASAEAYLQLPPGSRVPCWLRVVLPGHSLCLADRIAEDAEALVTWLDEERGARQLLLDNRML